MYKGDRLAAQDDIDLSALPLMSVYFTPSGRRTPQTSPPPFLPPFLKALSQRRQGLFSMLAPFFTISPFFRKMHAVLYKLTPLRCSLLHLGSHLLGSVQDGEPLYTLAA